jgi:two-component sensor histidine kinase
MARTIDKMENYNVLQSSKRMEELPAIMGDVNLERFIYVYDRDPSSAAALCGLLEQGGYESGALHDPDEVLKSLEAERPADLLIFSVRTPDWPAALDLARRVVESAGVFLLFYSAGIDRDIFESLRRVPHAGCVRGGGGSDYHFLAAVEAALQHTVLIREKDLLYRELRHRVKNNMLVIHSLLSLEGAKMTDPAAAAFSRIQDRIRAMIRLYDGVYTEGAGDAVALHNYVRDLSECLFDAYSTDPEKIIMETRVTPVHGSLKQAVPLGLILNELVCNVLKHAFPGDRHGTITIDLHREGKELFLSVKDDGAGLPEGFDETLSSSLGLRIVELMAAQLRGRLHFTTSPGRGTEFLVAFPLD